MTKNEFGKFLEQKARATTETPPVDWEAQKRFWLEKLADFYSTVEQYLAEFRDSGKVKLKMARVSLNEEHIGQYQANSMAILFGSDKVILAPIGTLLLGARGRVDMIGPAGTVKFVLTGKNSNGSRISVTHTGKNPLSKEGYVWKIATFPPKVRFIELRPETFFSALMEVVNG